MRTTWPLGRAFGVDVRVSWTICVWPLLFVYLFWEFVTPLEALLWGVAWTVGLFATVYTHEMGHILAGRRVGVPSERMTLRGLGGLAHMDAPAPTPKAGIFIALAGPVTHLPWLAVLYPTYWLAGGPESYAQWAWMLQSFAGLQLSLLIFNLMPVFPLDGGRALMGFLSLRTHSNRAALWTANVGFVGNGLFILAGLVAIFGNPEFLGLGHWGFLIAWIGIEGIQACRQLRMQARHGDVYEPVDPFQKIIMESQKIEEAERREREKKRAAQAKERAKRDALQRRVDELLDRINEVGGIDRLTDRERRELKEASAALRRAD